MRRRSRSRSHDKKLKRKERSRSRSRSRSPGFYLEQAVRDIEAKHREDLEVRQQLITQMTGYLESYAVTEILREVAHADDEIKFESYYGYTRLAMMLQPLPDEDLPPLLKRIQVAYGEEMRNNLGFHTLFVDEYKMMLHWIQSKPSSSFSAAQLQLIHMTTHDRSQSVGVCFHWVNKSVDILPHFYEGLSIGGISMLSENIAWVYTTEGWVYQGSNPRSRLYLGDTYSFCRPSTTNPSRFSVASVRNEPLFSFDRWVFTGYTHNHTVQISIDMTGYRISIEQWLNGVNRFLCSQTNQLLLPPLAQLVLDFLSSFDYLYKLLYVEPAVVEMAD